MKRTAMIVGVLAVVALALLIVACGSDPTPTVPAAPEAPQTVAPATPVPTATTPPQPTAQPTQGPTRAAPATTAAPTPAPTPEEPGEADPSDAYFAIDRVLEVSIEIDPDDWDTLRHQTRTFEELMAEIEKYNLSQPFADIYTWFPATVTIDGETNAEVGVRKKGFLGSQSDTKPSLKLRYDKYVDGQSLGGVMERMTLNNSVQDPSMVNTCLAYQVFAAAGNPAPRCNFANVTVNGMELGLYVHVEELKKPFLARHFDSAEGNLYEGTVSDFTSSHRGTMEKKTNEDEDDWSDVDAMVAALQDPSDAGLEALGELVDLDRFLTFWATEVLVGHWDGYAGDRNNYHFYREPDGKFVFIPWGVDDVFHLKDDPNPFDHVLEPPPSVLALSAIPNRLYNHPEWRAKYVGRLKELLDTDWNEDALLASVDAMAAILQEHALPEAKDERARDTERVRKFILKRKGEILADLTPEPPHWPEPEEAGATSNEFNLEAFEVRFETTWGSHVSANPLAEGKVYGLNEDGEWVASEGDAGATAGRASPQEETDIGVKDAAMITVMGLYPDGTIQGATFWMPADRIAAGVELSIGVVAGVGGVIWQIPAGKFEPEGFVPVTSGSIELTEADAEPGAVIAGRLYAGFEGSTAQVGEGEADGTESGSLEVRFETAWGTNQSVDPFSAGGSVTYLELSDIEESAEGVVAIAGNAGPDERLLLPDVADLASVAVFSLEEDGSLTGMTLVLPISQLTDGATLVMGEDNIAGGIWAIPPGGSVPDFFLPFTAGKLELSEAGSNEGAKISGSFTGTFGGAVPPTSAMEPIAETADTWLVINEVAAKGDPLDWFEIYNSTDQHISLANFFVADDLTDVGKRVAFPTNLTIAPGQYVQVEVNSDNWAGFNLGGGEELGIWTLAGSEKEGWSTDGDLVDSVDWDEGDSGEGESFARVPDVSGEFQTVGNPTPGAANSDGN